jgi:arylsulfatase A-like enzyme
MRDGARRQLVARAGVPDDPRMIRLDSLVLGGLALLAACDGRQRANPDAPSIVLVLVDQLRADAAERWMEETGALAARGVRIEAMRAAAPWTYPSVISLFSGLYPQQHGADADQAGTRLTTIDAAVPLLPRTLHDAGYHTAAFVTNPFLHEWNRPVRESFEHFDASFIGDQGPTRGHGDKVWTERMWVDTVDRAVRAHYDARPVGVPEFTYVHLIDVHGRREGPERWSGAPFAPSYEAAVRHVDRALRGLYDYFRARHGDELLFVVTSDHGQDLDDDIAVGDGPGFRMRKASLHDFNLRVPFWILPGRDVPAGVVLAGPCSNVDVAPTLLEWVGLAPPPGAAGMSLLPALRGAAYDGERRALFARNSTNRRLEECVAHDGLKLMRYREPTDASIRARRLFDLGADPREVQPLRRPAPAEERLLDELAAEPPLHPARFEEPDPELMEQLRGLGYGGEDE